MLSRELQRPGRVRRVPRVRLGTTGGPKLCDVPQSQVATTVAALATSATTTAAPSTLSTATTVAALATSAPLVGVRPSAVGVGLCWSVLDRFGRVHRVCRVRLGKPTQCTRAGVLLDQVSATTTNPITPANDGV